MSRSVEDGNVPASAEEAAIQYLATKLNVSKDTLEFKSGYSTDTATHVYVNQKLVRLSEVPRLCSR